MPISLCLSLLITASCARWAQEPRYGSLTSKARPFSFAHNIELFEISNGMKVALIRDTRTNLATVDVRYTVGAAEDPPGRTGLAHLVEHVLFELRPAPGQPTLGERLGAITLSNNAWTASDLTHYSSTALIEQLDAVIALEGERMNAGCAQLDDATFARERDVVLAETAQRSDPLIDLQYRLLASVYGARHPYARPLTNNEVGAATRDEVCAFIGQHYGPNRAYLVVTGPFDVARVRALIGKTFGRIARRAPGLRTAVPTPRLDGTVSRHSGPIDRPRAVVYLAHPAWGAKGTVTYRVAAQQLSRALATANEEKGWIVNTAVTTDGGARAPVLAATVEVKSPDHLEAAADEVFHRAGHMFDDVSRAGLERLGDEMVLDYLSSWDDLASRGNWIADFLQFTDHHWFMLMELRAIEQLDWKITAATLTANLTATHAHVALITPSDGPARTRLTAVPTGTHDIEPWRAPVDPADADRPLRTTDELLLGGVERYQLTNGLNVELAVDDDSPLIEARLVFPVGRAHEPPDRPQLATAAAWMLGPDYEGFLSGAQIVRLSEAISHGTQLDSDVSELATTFTARGLSQWGDWHVWFLSWLLDQGVYNRSTIDELHAHARDLATQDDDEIDLDELAFSSRLYGEGHPYATPPPARGAAYARISGGDLTRWRRERYRAYGATLIVSGAFDVAAMKREIDELFGPWSADGPPMLPPIPTPRPAAGPSWLADDDDGASQVGVQIGFASASDPVKDRAARRVLTLMLAERLREIRERTGASYGVHVSYDSGAAGGALLIGGMVDEAKAGAAVASILATIAAMRDDAAAQREAFVRARRAALAVALQQAGGAARVATLLEWRAAWAQPLDIFDRTAARIASLTPADVAAIAAIDLAPTRMVVKLEGRPAAIDAAFAALAITPERVAPRGGR